MGASEWRYVVPYQDDLGRALNDLRAEVFANGEYCGVPDELWDDDEEDQRPETIEELWADEGVRVEGTHSILDMVTLAAPQAWNPEPGTVVVTSAKEAELATGTSRPSREDLEKLVEQLTEERWIGRCAVLYRENEPNEIAFWGISGD